MADRNEHPVGLILPNVALLPLDLVCRDRVDVSQVGQDSSKVFLAISAGLGCEKLLPGRLQDPVELRVHGEFVDVADELVANHRSAL